jgi:23S rRNA pseudouridine955/2504/2580 synthase
VQRLTVDAESAGQRLDNYLLRILKGVPKTHVYRVIRSGEVRVNKGRASADTRIEAGDEVRIPPVRVPERAAAAPVPAREFPVLFEDEHLLVIDKPAGVAVHGGSGVSFGVIEQLRRARPQAKFLELVHRLDKETSGVLVLAKKRSALTHLQDQFRGRETGKTYAALVWGDWPEKLKVIDVALHKYLDGDGERRVRQVTAPGDPAAEHAKRSITPKLTPEPPCTATPAGLSITSRCSSSNSTGNSRGGVVSASGGMVSGKRMGGMRTTSPRFSRVSAWARPLLTRTSPARITR